MVFLWYVVWQDERTQGLYEKLFLAFVSIRAYVFSWNRHRIARNDVAAIQLVISSGLGPPPPLQRVANVPMTRDSTSDSPLEDVNEPSVNRILLKASAAAWEFGDLCLVVPLQWPDVDVTALSRFMRISVATHASTGDLVHTLLQGGCIRNQFRCTISIPPFCACTSILIVFSDLSRVHRAGYIKCNES